MQLASARRAPLRLPLTVHVALPFRARSSDLDLQLTQYEPDIDTNPGASDGTAVLAGQPSVCRLWSTRNPQLERHVYTSKRPIVPDRPPVAKQRALVDSFLAPLS